MDKQQMYRACVGVRCPHCGSFRAIEVEHQLSVRDIIAQAEITMRLTEHKDLSCQPISRGRMKITGITTLNPQRLS